MTDILLSVHPRWADLIIERKKTIEVRRTWIQKLECGDTIYLYSTSPVKKIVGQCTFYWDWPGNCDCPDWMLMLACLSRDELAAYLPWPRYGHFLEVIDPKRYDEPRPLSDFGLARPPQSFRYVDKSPSGSV